MSTVLHMCHFCGGLILDPKDAVEVAYEPGMSGPGCVVMAHREHATLVKPDPRPLQLLDRIQALRAARPTTKQQQTTKTSTPSGPAPSGPRGLAGYCWLQDPETGLHCTWPVGHEAWRPDHWHAYTKTSWT